MKTFLRANVVASSVQKTYALHLRFVIISGILLVMFGLRVNAATITSTTTGGNWNATTSWVGGVVPVAADLVIIADGATVTTNVAVTCASLTVGQGTSGILNVGAFNLTVSGATIIAAGGSISITSITGTKTFTGDFTNNGTWTNTIGSAVTFSGNITNNGTFTGGTGVYTLSGVNKSITGNIQIASLTLSGGYANNGTLSVFTTLAGAGTLINAATGIFNVSVATITPTLTATAVGNTVNYVGAVAQNVKGTTYSNLTINNSGFIATSTGAVTANNLTITAGTFATGAFAITATATTINGGTLSINGATAKTLGNVTVASSGTINISTNVAAVNITDLTMNTGASWVESQSAPVTIAGNLVLDATFTTTFTGVHTFSGTTKTISGSGTFNVPNVAFTGTYTNNLPVLTVNTALTGTGTLTMGSNTILNIGGTSTITTLNCTANIPNEVVYNGTAAQSVKLTTYYNLTINKASNIASLLAGNTNVNNNLSLISGTLTDIATASIIGNATGTFSVSDGAVYETVKTTGNFFPTLFTGAQINFNTVGGFEYGAAAAVSIPTTPVTSYGRLIISGSGIKTLQANTTVNSLAINGGTLADGGFQITGSGTESMTMAANTGLTLGRIAVGSAFPLNFTSANTTLNATSTVTYNSNQPQVISPTPLYGNLALVSTAAIVRPLSGNTSVQTNVNIGANNTLDLLDKTLSIAGGNPLTVSATNGFLKADNPTSVLRFNGSGTTQQIVSSIAAARLISGYVYNIECANTGTSLVRLVGTNVQVYNLQINSGATFDANNSTLSVYNSYTNSGTIQAITSSGTLEFNRPSGAQSFALGNSVGTTSYIRLEVSNPLGVTLAGPALVGGLDFTTGILNTTSTNLLTIFGVATGSVTGESATTYVKGPMARRFASSSANTFVFPIGKTGLNSFTLIAPTVSGTTDILAEVFDAATGGTPGSGMASLATNRYWQSSVTAGSLTSVSNVQLTESGLTALSSIGQSSALTGVYNFIGGSIASNTVTSETTVAPSLGYFVLGDRLPMSGIVEVGPGSADGLFTLTANGGLFQAMNVRGLNGNLTARIIGDVSIEDGTNALNQWSEYSGSGYTFTIISSASVNRTISGAYNGSAVTNSGLIRLNGANRVFFNGGTGTQRFLTFRNTSTGATAVSALALYRDASNNTFNNCVFESGSTGATNYVGVINYNATSGTSGIDNNTILRCDIRDLTTSTSYPRFGIMSLGISTTVSNDNNTVQESNIYNFYLNGSGTGGSCGIWVSNYNSQWNISQNNVYQQISRNTTTAGNFDGIRIEGTAIGTAGLGSVGHTINNNKIGGSGRDVSGNITGTWAETGLVASRFRGIAVSQISGTASEIQNNRISNFSFSSSSGATSAPGIFAGIHIGGAGNINIGTTQGNMIGDTTGQDNIVVTISTAGGISFGITNASTGTVSMVNNKIGSFTLLGSGTTISHAFDAIGNSSSAATVTISNNMIGSAGTARNIRANTATTVTATGTAQNVTGIYSVGSSGGNVSIIGNQIRNLYVNSAVANTSTIIRGVEISGVTSVNISGNTIANLESEATNNGTTLSAAIIGILNNQNAGGTTTRIIENNTIYGLQNNSTSATATHIYGIFLNATTGTPTNTVSRNFIHSFNSSNTSTTTEQVGIYVNYNATLVNNMIRLGTKTDGTSNTQPHIISGISDATTNSSFYYYNTVVINGTAPVGAVNTYAFRRSVASGTKDVRNNIFVNTRTGGTGLHFAFATNTLTGYSASNFDYNIFHSTNNTEFSIVATPTALTGATSALRMQNLRAQVPIGNNLHSGIGTLSQINFVNAGGTSSTVDLRLGNSNCAAGAGIAISGITTDFDNVITRSSAPAIGAHESATFNTINSVYDIYTANFTFTNIPTQSPACAPPQPIIVDVTITDIGTGIPVTGSNVPQMWWRLSTGTYTNAVGVLQSGTANNGVWRFTINPTLALSQTYQYYFVAEDQASTINRWFSNFEATTPVHPAVTVQTTPPVSPSTFSVASVSPLSGTVTVGVGGTYTTFGGVGGLFEAINNGGLVGDLTALVIGNITDINTNSLNQWNEYCGSNYRLYIRPQTTGMKVVSVTAANGGGFGFIKLAGADRVIFDGSFGGSGNFLTFRNLYTSTANVAGAIYMDGVCQNDTLRNITIEGQGHHLQGGNLIINTSTGSNVYVKDCNIKGVASNQVPNNLVYSASSGNGSYTITGCNIYDFSNFGSSSSGQRATGILVSGLLSPTATWNITNNSIYNTFIDGQGPQTAIDFSPGAGSNNNVISNNYIGGSSPQCGTGGAVTYWGNNYNPSSIEVRINGINVSCGTITLDNNNITNIYVSGSDYTGFVCMGFGGVTVPIVTNNVFGTGAAGVPDNTKIIQVNGGALGSGLLPGYIYGIWNNSTSTSTATYSNNSFYYLFQSGSTSGGNVYGISHQSRGAAIITNNVMNGLQASGIDYNSYGIRISPTVDVLTPSLIEGNIITGPYINSTVPGATNAAIYVNTSTAITVNGAIKRNIIYDMRNSGASTAAYASYSEGLLLLGKGNWDINNNQIYLNNNGLTNKVGLYGIDDEFSAGSIVNYYNNTVHIAGTQLNTGTTDNSSYAFLRLPGSTGTVAGSTINLKNNIFINSRNNGGTSSYHFGISNYGSASATNWNASASNYNFVSTLVPGNACQWGTTLYTFDNWKNIPSAGFNDANSWYVPAITAGSSSATQLNPNDLFTNLAGFNLTIKTNNQAAWFVNGKGVAGLLSGNLTTDLGGDARTTTYGYGTDIGADEFTPSVLPHDLVLTPTLGGTNTFTFAGRTLGNVVWGGAGTVPTSITARYFSGQVPGSSPSPAYAGTQKADFMLELVPTGGAGFTYNTTINYDNALVGDFVVGEGNMKMIKTVSTSWTDVTSTVDSVNNILATSAPLSAFSYFSGGATVVTPLPIELISFTANCDGGKVKLNWSTATEINNDYFTIHRSTDLIHWEEIITATGAGNSNQIRHYQSTDDRPLNGVAYYKLSQHDYDGTTESFNPVSVNCYSDGSGNNMSVYPNPATDNFKVSITMAEEISNAVIMITDINGKNILQRNINLSVGTNEYSFDREGIHFGTYIVQLKSNDVNLKPVKLIIQ